MIGLRCVQVFTMVLLMACSMSGCGRGIFNTEPFTDTTRDAQGRSIAADTPRNWEFFRELVDPQISSEAQGKRPPGFPTWNEKWVRQLRHIESGRENATKYIAYIIESRRRAGLPELEGYPSPASD